MSNGSAFEQYRYKNQQQVRGQTDSQLGERQREAVGLCRCDDQGARQVMTDRELLELAAKAAGMAPRDQWAYDEEWGLKVSTGAPPYEWWNPLTDDGDALRLAVDQMLKISVYGEQVFALTFCGKFQIVEKVDGNPLAATRRAIVRAAAEIGRKMQ